MKTSTPNSRQKRDRAVGGDSVQFTPLKISGRVAAIDNDIFNEVKPRS